MGTRVIDSRRRQCHPQTTLSITPWERRRSRDHVGTRCKAMQVSQQLLFLLLVRLWDAPMHHGISLSFLILVSTAYIACVLRYMPEDFLAACRAL